jgi:hypothetical protein
VSRPRLCVCVCVCVAPFIANYRHPVRLGKSPLSLGPVLLGGVGGHSKPQVKHHTRLEGAGRQDRY